MLTHTFVTWRSAGYLTSPRKLIYHWERDIWSVTQAD